MKVAYFFSGMSRKASVMTFIFQSCKNAGFGMELYEVDIMNNWKHDLISEDLLEEWIARV